MEGTSSFGYWVRRRRKALDFTQAELARRVACTLSTIKKIEFDERRPSVVMAERLAECLQIPGSERAEFIKIARALHSTERLGFGSEPLTSGSSSQRKTNIPLPPNRLIGRLEQIAGINEYLRKSEVHLVTLTGPGGVGKTRLALQAARDLTDDYPDGAWLVELASISNPALVPQAVISTLKLPPPGARPPLEVLTNYLGSRHLLLILDNCEHLQETCAGLVHALLSACPRLDILCTSRESLNTPEEYLWWVPPLSLPDLNSPITLDVLSQNEAVSLFVDRAMHVQPTFALSEQNAPIIAQICCRMGGLPLAIELAAARVRVLSVEEIDARLDDSLNLLDGGFRTVATRLQTMRAAIEWSYVMLSFAEQALLRRLSVFTGGWTLEAAEEVCPSPGDAVEDKLNPASILLRQDDVLVLLTGLESKSMITRIEGQGQEVRYTLLETIRQFAAEKLLEADEVEAVRQRHLEYYTAWVEMVAPNLYGPQQHTWSWYLDVELENLRLALKCSLDSAPGYGLRMATALYRYWTYRSLAEEAMSWLSKLVDLPENQPATIYRGRALGVLTSVGFYLVPEPEVWAKESLAISETLQDEQGRAFALWMLGCLRFLRHGDFDQGQLYLTASLEAFQSIGNRWGMAQVLYHMTNLAFRKGDALSVREYAERCLSLYREVGDLHGIAYALTNLASVIIDNDADLNSAQKLVEESLIIFRQLGTMMSMHNALYDYAVILTWRGEYALARKALEERVEIISHSSTQLAIAEAEVFVASVDRGAGQVETAMIKLEECLETMRASDQRLVSAWYLCRALHELAYLLARRGDVERASRLLQEASENNQVPEHQTTYYHCKGTVAMVEHKASAALADFLQSLKICVSSYIKLNAILAMEGIAGALSLLDAPEQASRFLSASTAFRCQIGAPVSPWDLPVYKRLNGSLIRKLGAVAFAQAWKDGQALSFEQAIEEALQLQPATGGTHF